MNTITSFFKYLIDVDPGTQFKFYVPMIILVAILILGSIVFRFLYKTKKDDFAFKRLFKKTSGRLFGLGMLFLFLTLVRYENIPYFSMRLLLYLSFILLAYFIYRTVYTYKMVYPKEKANVSAKLNKVKEASNKYLPNKKKR